MVQSACLVNHLDLSAQGSISRFDQARVFCYGDYFIRIADNMQNRDMCPG